MSKNSNHIFKFGPIFLMVLFLLSGCTSNILSNVYVGFLGGEEIELNTNDIRLENYEYIKFNTVEDIELKGETIVALEYSFYASSSTTIDIKIYWKALTKKLLYSSTLDVIEGSNFIDIELNEDEYFKIKRNSVQYLIFEVESELDDFKYFIAPPDILTI
ncbi:MAG: hypothetical protein K6G38_00480 [Gammaproteobacteria bacterium]|nr:hypothetical protein [Gammaproteobacteria bacterium]